MRSRIGSSILFGLVTAATPVAGREPGGILHAGVEGSSILLPVGVVLGALTFAAALAVVLRQHLRRVLRERDVARRESEEARRSLEDRVRFEIELLDRIPVPIFMKNAEGVYQHCNRALSEFLGFSREDIVGKTAKAVVPPDLARLYAEEDKRLLEGERVSSSYETAIPRADGTVADVMLHKSRLESATGTTIMGAFMDISQRKRHEAELMSALEQAEAASVAKSQFLATISHELRTPLHAILGLTECLVSEETTRLQSEWIGMIADAGERLLVTIEDMLLVSSLQQGTVEVRHEPFRASEVVQHVYDATKQAAWNKGLQYDCRISRTTEPLLQGDAIHVERIVRKLVDNAIKFTHRGSVRIEVSFDDVDDGRTTLRIDVEDTGVGIEEKRCQIIFDPFVQADGSSTRQHQGTGLGLTVAHRLAELLEGTISVESEPAVGSRFRLSVPFDRVAEPQAALELEPAGAV